MMKGFFLCFLVIAFAMPAQHAAGAIVDSVQVWSNAMHRNSKAVVIKPTTYNKSKALPVVYLLHGYSGNQNDWITKVKDLPQYADLYDIIIVCPDGGFSSWYFDSPIDSSFKYETYVVRELVNWVDEHYSTIKNRTGRAITGLSMGGHGALYLAFRHQEVFGAAGSMSGGVDLRPFPLNWDIAKRIGSYARYPERWEQSSVINLTYLLTANSLALLIDCGSEDFFYTVNVQLHEKLLNTNIPHDFISRPGAHNWAYWGNAISYQLLFMNKYFRAGNKS